jgi:hypothetical protein
MLEGYQSVEYNLKAVALKAVACTIRFCETDTERQAEGCAGEKYAPAPRCTSPQPGSPSNCGVDRTYLSSVERSERNASIDNIARIARGLQIEPWRLLKDD